MRPATISLLFLSTLILPAPGVSQPLVRAVTTGDLSAVNQLIQAGADVNQRDNIGQTPLIWASRQGRLEIVRSLLRAGADPNVKDQNGGTPESSAFEFGHFDVVEALIQGGANVDRDRLRNDVNAKDASGQPLLARVRDPASLSALVRLGADPNATPRDGGRTVLTDAAFAGDLDRVRALIEAGADVNAKDPRGYTPLWLASNMGHSAVVQALVNARADANWEGPGSSTALMQASYFDRIEIARMLIPVSNVNFRNKDGITALMLARWNCHTEIVDALTRAGAVPAKDEWRRAPRFTDFPAAPVYQGAPAPVDIRSHPKAPNYRTRLREGARKGSNFAGHYTVVGWGCGSNCESTMIVDARTGRVYDGFGAERGAEFKPDSRLVIADPAFPGSNAYPEDPTWSLPVRYYVWEGQTFRLIYEESCTAVDGHQKCGCGDESGRN